MTYDGSPCSFAYSLAAATVHVSAEILIDHVVTNALFMKNTKSDIKHSMAIDNLRSVLFYSMLLISISIPMIYFWVHFQFQSFF